MDAMRENTVRARKAPNATRFLAAALVVLTGCMSSGRYVATTPSAGQCQQQCRTSNPLWNDYLQCFARCPGVEYQQGTCSEATPAPQPEAACEDTTGVDGHRTGIVVLVLAAAAGLLYELVSHARITH